MTDNLQGMLEKWRALFDQCNRDKTGDCCHGVCANEVQVFFDRLAALSAELHLEAQSDSSDRILIKMAGKLDAILTGKEK